jgi:hypothetical protein
MLFALGTSPFLLYPFRLIEKDVPADLAGHVDQSDCQ